MSQQSTPTTPPAPPVPQATSPGGGVTAQSQNLRPLTQREIEAIRDRRSDMSTQLTSAVDRRNELAEELKTAPPGTEQGILNRIQLLDTRILQIERDIESSGQMIRSGMTVNDGTALVAPEDGGLLGLPDSTVTILGIVLAFTFVLPLSMGFMRLLFRRASRRDAAAGRAADQDRMDRLEQAVDAVALEIERVGEAQRYQQRLLTEANLIPALAPSHRGAAGIDGVANAERSPVK